MPRERGRLSIPLTVALLLLGLLLLYGGVAAGAAIRVAVQGISFDEGMRQVVSEPLGPGLAQLIALGTVVLIGARLAYGDVSLREALRIRPVSAQVALLSIAAGAAMHFPLVELMTVLAQQFPALAPDEDTLRQVEQMTRIDGPVRAITVPLTVVVIAAGTEELVFRGLLLPALRPQLGGLGALALTAVLFGVFHLDESAAIYGTIAGLVLGAIALRTGSVVPCIAFHGAFNAVPLVLPEELVAIPGFNVAEAEAHMPLSLVLASLVVFAIAMTLLYRVGEPSSD